MIKMRIVVLVLFATLTHCSSGDEVAGAGGTAEAGPDATEDVSVDAAIDAVADANAGSDAAALPDAGRCSVTGDGRTTMSFVNRCVEPVTFQGSDIEGGTLAPGAIACRDIGSSTESIPSKRYWGFIDIDPGGGRHSLAEFTFNTDFEDFDWYNLSHVDAFNLPLQIVAVDQPTCRALTCGEDLLASCPSEGRYPAEGEPVACVSPDRDDPNNPVASYFEASCADAYSWSGDDAESMAACAGEDYDVVFCPG